MSLAFRLKRMGDFKKVLGGLGPARFIGLTFSSCLFQILLYPEFDNPGY